MLSSVCTYKHTALSMVDILHNFAALLPLCLIPAIFVYCFSAANTSLQCGVNVHAQVLT